MCTDCVRLSDGEVTQHTVLQYWPWSSQAVHVILFSEFSLEVAAQPG